jgi:hypothetical protein
MLAVTLFLRSMLWLLITANVFPSSPIPVTMMMEVIRSSETSVLRRASWHNMPEDGILHSQCRENPKSYAVDKLFALWFQFSTRSLGITALNEHHLFLSE